MKVKIIKCSRDSYWYANNIGDFFDVDYDKNLNVYRLTGRFYRSYSISADDCECIHSELSHHSQSYVKVISRNFIYYIDTNHIVDWMKERADKNRGHIHTASTSHVIFDKRTNGMIKCRVNVEALPDVFKRTLLTITLEDE